MSAKTTTATTKTAAVPGEAEAPKKKSRKLLWIAMAVVLLGAGGGGAYWWSARASAAAAPLKKEPTKYFAIDPSFTVNLADTDGVRYLQADVQLATRDPETLAAFQEQSPALRNRLLLLFGQQTSAQLAQRSGKERLQEKSLAEVKAVLKAEGAPAKVDAVIFTSLVTQ